MIKLFFPIIILCIIYILFFLIPGEYKYYPMFIGALLFYPLLILQLFLIIPIIYKKIIDKYFK